MAQRKTSNTKAVSDEEIIAAILQHGSLKEAAAAAGISTRAIYDRMEDRSFRSLYMAAKDDIIRGAVFSVNRKLSQAIDVIAEIMEDKDNNPAIRLQAAQVIIKNAGQFAERLQKDEYNSRQAEDIKPTEINELLHLLCRI